MQITEALATPSWLKIIRTQKSNPRGKLSRLSRSDQKTSPPAQLKVSIYSTVFMAIYMAFREFAHILWEAPKPTIVFTEYKSVTRFFQTKPMPPSLWNACNYVLQLNFKIAHNAGSVNTAAGFLSRVQLKKSRRRSVSISGRMYKQHPSRWQHLPRVLQTKNNSSSQKQMVTMFLQKMSFNEPITLGKRQQNSHQMRNHPQWSQVSRNSQRSTETLRRIPWMELRQKHDYD